MSFFSPSNYSAVQKLAHWTIVVLCVAEFPTAGAIRRTHHVNPFGIKPESVDLLLHKVHAWSGWAILLLAIVLLALRVFRGAPELPQGMTRLERGLARLSHVALYSAILILVITGTVAAYVSARYFSPLHIAFTYIGIGLVLVHAAAALWHQFVRRDDLLSRMLPNRRRRDRREDATSR